MKNPLPTDPIAFKNKHWPDVTFYDEQEEIIYSVQNNIETVVPAGNALGKDFIAAFITLWFFCTRRPARVVTTSVKHDQLRDVLWGEMRRFINSAVVPLPIIVNHMHIRQIYDNGEFVDLTEIVGQVVQKGEGLLGRHLPRFDKSKEDGGDGFDTERTLIVFDEASAIDDATYESSLTWSHRRLIIGNPWPCENFFRKAVDAGDKLLTEV